jgi:hypothetical protein
MTTGKPPTERLQVMLALKTHAFLAILAEKGMHGTSIPDVAKSLIENGIREARRDGHFTAEEIAAVQGRK